MCSFVRGLGVGVQKGASRCASSFLRFLFSRFPCIFCSRQESRARCGETDTTVTAIPCERWVNICYCLVGGGGGGGGGEEAVCAIENAKM